ncbi:CDGSH iron-sulfur domain-containing protein [Sulfurospirillum sp.]|nr:CDGSH iron-sulfur domain-containing protein [Sulfurospirillum sp.]
MSKISIKSIENGPLRLSVDTSEDTIKNVLFNSNGKSITIKKNSILCRCGKSKQQPFCDGVHRMCSFSSSNTLEEEIIQKYDGKEINIIFNRSICAGAGTCVRNFPKIYKNASEDWINPDGDSIDEVKKSVKKCPSGALFYEFKDENSNEKYDGCKITIIKNGPMNIIGNVDLNVDKWSTNANQQKYSLCRCGASENKPFCDYTHASLKAKNYTF